MANSYNFASGRLGIPGTGQGAVIGYNMPAEGFFAACGVEVIEWPWTVDDVGVAYPSGLLGVRSRCFRDTTDSLYDEDFWTAVPSVLPSGYTLRNRRHVFPAIQDFLGDAPASGPGIVGFGSSTVSWRGPNGIETYANDHAWGPWNLNQKSEEIFTGASGGAGWWYYTTTPYSPDTFWIAPGANQVGYRAAYIPFSGGHTTTLSYGWTDLGVTPTVLADINILTTHTSTGGYETVTLANAPSNGVLKSFWFVFNDWPPDNHIYACPRVDVPLWFTATFGNLVAPGGTVT